MTNLIRRSRHNGGLSHLLHSTDMANSAQPASQPASLPPDNPSTMLLDWEAVESEVQRLDTQRQTLVVQHTIAMNARLQRTLVPDGIREFLLEVWVEVLAEVDSRTEVSPELARTLRDAGEELARMAGTRREHDRQQLKATRFPALLPMLVQGMELLCLGAAEQAEHLQNIEHGMSEPVVAPPGTDPTDAWSAAVLLLSRREPFVDSFRLKSHRQLNDSSLRSMTYTDHVHLHVVSHGGLVPNQQRLQHMRELKVGDQFWRRPNPRAAVMVQVEWMGADGQLVLMCDEFHTGYLYHPMRVAHHMQAGLLVPVPKE